MIDKASRSSISSGAMNIEGNKGRELGDSSRVEGEGHRAETEVEQRSGD